MTVTMSNTVPETAKRRGRPKGATKQLGRDFLNAARHLDHEDI